MNLTQYLRALRAHWLLICVSVLICTAAAAAYAWTRDPVYAATTQLFVSTNAEAGGVSSSEVYQGGLASQSRAESYARIVSSPPVAEAVIERLGLDESPDEVRESISAAVPSGTVLIDITVRDDSAVEARDIAAAVAEEFPAFINELEGAGSPDDPAPVEVTVTSPASVPESPESPRKPLLVVLGLFLGLVIGLAAAVLREVLDRRVRDDDETEAIAGAPVLSQIPHDKRAQRRPLVVVEEPDSPEAEAYRRLRTNLRPVTIDRGRHEVLVTSAVAGEGKTLIAANLAFAFAQSGHEVVLVDGDLRRPRLSHLLGLDRGPGLSEVLSGEEPDAVLHREHELPLQVLTSGKPPPNPAELLESERFAAVLADLSGRAEVVIVDSPALLPVSDGAIMARSVSAVLMVARASATRAEQLDAAADVLRAVRKRPVGAVLNGRASRAGRDYVYAPSTPRAPARPVWQ